MKKLLTIAAIAAASTALAVESSNTFGILKVPMTTQNAVIAVPWVGCGNATGTATIKVADIVKTANLQAGDFLFVYDNGSYSKGFQLTTTVEGVLKWTGMQIIGKGLNVPAGDESSTLSRGQALVLSCQTAPGTIYLYGQYDTTAKTTPTIAAATEVDGKVVPTYTLLAAPGTDDVALDDTLFDGVGSADSVFVPGEVPVYWHTNAADGKSGFGSTSGNPFNTSLTIKTVPAGKGFWYISRSTTAPTLMKW